MKMLIIDDHEDNQVYMRFLAERDGYEVILHGYADDALECARQTQPDMVVIDVVLPGKLNGLDIARQLRQDEVLNGVAILVTTAGPETYTRKMALDAGCDAYLPKPFRANDWHNIIEQLRQIKSG